jgi:hypothetical protein
MTSADMTMPETMTITEKSASSVFAGRPGTLKLNVVSMAHRYDWT